MDAQDIQSNYFYSQECSRVGGLSTLSEDSLSFFIPTKETSVAVDHRLKQPPFGQEISFTPRPGSIRKETYKDRGLAPRIIYAQDDLRGNGVVTDSFTVSKDDTVVFLVGPSYRSTPVAQWRLNIIEHLAPHLPVNTVLVVPQYKYIAFADGPGGKETQIEWEGQWLERADFIAADLSLYWKNPDGSLGNIGPTTRFETAYYFAKFPDKDITLYIPSDPEPDGLDWIYFHAQDLGIPIHRDYTDFYQNILDRCHS